MTSARLLLAVSIVLVFAGISTWVVAADSRGAAPAGRYDPQRLPAVTLRGEDADARRMDMVKRAAVRLEPGEAARLSDTAVPASDPLARALPTCRFLNDEPSGTSAKFDCVFDGGEVVKVKYGRNPEIQAEVAATRLLRLLDYPSDTVVVIPRLRCYGCPRFPFIAMTLLWRTYGANMLAPYGHENGYTDFDWVAVERKFPARAIETETLEGWAWWELKHSAAPRADLDALRLVAVLLAHWDNKHSNQRLVCLDESPAAANGGCERPLALMQDVGATFGPRKVNLARWRQEPVWTDRASCLVSMRTLPYKGSTFPDARISEAGRAQMAGRLAAISDEQIAELFADARFPQYHSGTDDHRDLMLWTETFRQRADQIVKARCMGE